MERGCDIRWRISLLSRNILKANQAHFKLGKVGEIILLTLSSTAQVICDLAFLMLTAQKSLKRKNSEKITFFVFSIFFASGLSHYNDAFLTYFTKSAKKQKSVNPGHMRPGP